MSHDRKRSIGWKELSASQKKGANDLAEHLLAALAGSQEKSAEEGQQVAFVSGRRGCGKTTVLRVMQDLVQERRIKKSVGTENNEKKNPVDRVVEERELITWLDPIPLDPLPDGANLVAAIFSRLSDSNRVIRREIQQGGGTGVLDVASDFDRARNELNALQTKAVLALEGNALDRRPNVDQDTFAINALENERTRPALQGKLTQILNRILESRGGRDGRGLFVVVIDDIDVRPSRAVEALQLVSLLAIPRLFFVFSGILDTVDQLLLYRTQNEFLKALGKGADDFIRADVQGRANEIASSLLRKLVPPDRRIFISTMSVQDAWDKSWGDKDDTRDIPMSEIVGGWGTGGPNTLARRIKWGRLDLSELIAPTEHEKVKEKWRHPGSELVLAAPQRQLHGFYIAMKSKREGTIEGNGDLGISHYVHMRKELWLLFEAVVDEDPKLGIPAQRHLKGMLRGWSDDADKGRGTASNLAVLSLRGIQTTASAGVQLTCDVVEKSGKLHSQVVVCDISQRILTVKCDAEKNPRMLGDDAAAMFMLVHDFCVLHDQSHVNGGLEWTPESRRLLAHTSYRSPSKGEPRKTTKKTSKTGGLTAEAPEIVETGHYEWYCMTWPTYRDEQRFLHKWNHVIETMGVILRERSRIKGNQLAVLLALGFCAAVIETGRDTLVRLLKTKVGDSAPRARRGQGSVGASDTTTSKSPLGKVRMVTALDGSICIKEDKNGTWALAGIKLVDLKKEINDLKTALGTQLDEKLLKGEEDHDFALGFEVYVQLERLLDSKWSPLHAEVIEVGAEHLRVQGRLEQRKIAEAQRRAEEQRRAEKQRRAEERRAKSEEAA